jgi:hypothetical protein
LKDAPYNSGSSTSRDLPLRNAVRTRLGRIDSDLPPWGLGASMKKLLVVLLALALAACATVKSNTASGKPEITVAGSSAGAVKGYIKSEMMNRGYAPHSSSESLIVFDKLAPTNAGSTWMAMSVGPLTMRTTFTVIEVNGSVRVVGSPALIAWAGYPREQPVGGSSPHSRRR